MPFGLPTWSTCSTGAKSTPRSSDDVQTTHFSVPSRSPPRSSRTSRSIEPWWRRAVSQSGRASAARGTRVSACERVLVNSSVVRAGSIARTGSSSFRPRWPAHGKRSSVAGITATDLDALVSVRAPAPPAAPGSEQHVARLVEVRDRRREPHVRSPGEHAQPREPELELHAALAAEQFVPLVDDDARARPASRRASRRSSAAPTGSRASSPAPAAAGLRGAGARSRRCRRCAARRARAAERVAAAAQVPREVVGERAQRRDPQHAQAGLARPLERLEHGPEPGGGVLPLPVAALMRRRSAPRSRPEPGLASCRRSARSRAGLAGEPAQSRARAGTPGTPASGDPPRPVEAARRVMPATAHVRAPLRAPRRAWCRPLMTRCRRRGSRRSPLQRRERVGLGAGLSLRQRGCAGSAARRRDLWRVERLMPSNASSNTCVRLDRAHRPEALAACGRGSSGRASGSPRRSEPGVGLGHRHEFAVAPDAEGVVGVEVGAAAVAGLRVDQHGVERVRLDLPLPPGAARRPVP
jgi:hypothetical protein